MGEEVMIDSTPLRAQPKDKDATYSGHYKILGYKLQTLRDVETGIPLEYHICELTDYDGYYLMPLLLRARMNGIEPKKIYMDCAYANFENLARLNLYWKGIEIKCNIAKDWKIHREANDQEIYRWYNQLWNNPLYVSQASLEYQQLFLVMNNDGENSARHELVGAYYRNKILKEYYADPEAYLNDYHLRNRIEHHHGMEKLQTQINHISASGIERFTTHCALHLIAIMGLALARLQKGISANLVELGNLI